MKPSPRHIQPPLPTPGDLDWLYLVERESGLLDPKTAPEHARGMAHVLLALHGEDLATVEKHTAQAVGLGVAKTWLASQAVVLNRPDTFRAATRGEPWLSWAVDEGMQAGKEDLPCFSSFMSWVLASRDGAQPWVLDEALQAGWDPLVPMEVNVSPVTCQNTQWTPLAMTVLSENAGLHLRLWQEDRVRLDQDSLDESLFSAAILLSKNGHQADKFKPKTAMLVNGGCRHWLAAGANPNRPFMTSQFNVSRERQGTDGWVPETAGQRWTQAMLMRDLPIVEPATWRALVKTLTPETWPEFYEDPLYHVTGALASKKETRERHEALSVLARTVSPTTAQMMIGRTLSLLLKGDMPDEKTIREIRPRDPQALLVRMMNVSGDQNQAWPLKWARQHTADTLQLADAVAAVQARLEKAPMESIFEASKETPCLAWGTGMTEKDRDEWQVFFSQIQGLAQNKNLSGLPDLAKQQALLLCATQGADKVATPPKPRL